MCESCPTFIRESLVVEPRVRKEPETLEHGAIAEFLGVTNQQLSIRSLSA